MERRGKMKKPQIPDLKNVKNLWNMFYRLIFKLCPQKTLRSFLERLDDIFKIFLNSDISYTHVIWKWNKYFKSYSKKVTGFSISLSFSPLLLTNQITYQRTKEDINRGRYSEKGQDLTNWWTFRDWLLCFWLLIGYGYMLSKHNWFYLFLFEKL